jgi:hypothetical protein
LAAISPDAMQQQHAASASITWGEPGCNRTTVGSRNPEGNQRQILGWALNDLQLWLGQSAADREERCRPTDSECDHQKEQSAHDLLAVSRCLIST